VIACGTCRESANIEITRDAGRAGDPAGRSARWLVLCAQCGASGELVDRW
jgi:hypothetical protein